MIELKHLGKIYSSASGSVEALKDVNLTIADGEIFGIIGFSGAGKSTLIRLVNGLETLDSGTVTVHGEELGSLKKPQLRKLRRKIGMVFQQFNLLESKTVYHNIALPLILEKVPKAEIDKKVKEVLQFVELEDKKDVYVSQLSGGQKQRVGIARALTTTPDILLCDEATSALDPQTTESILKLLKKINKEMGVTILLITHQMQVVQMICNKVAVMENGKVVEIQPTKKTTTIKLVPRIGIGIILGGGSRSTGGGVGVDVSPQKSGVENGLKIMDRFNLKPLEEKTISVGIEFKDLQLKDNPEVKINKGKIIGTIYFNDRDGKVDTLKIPIDINLK